MATGGIPSTMSKPRPDLLLSIFAAACAGGAAWMLVSGWFWLTDALLSEDVAQGLQFGISPFLALWAAMMVWSAIIRKPN
jgi:hypothetical protein